MRELARIERQQNRKSISLCVPVKETGHHIPQRVSDGLSLRVSTEGKILLHLAQVIDTATKLSQAAVHQVDVERVLGEGSEGHMKQFVSEIMGGVKGRG